MFRYLIAILEAHTQQFIKSFEFSEGNHTIAWKAWEELEHFSNLLNFSSDGQINTLGLMGEASVDNSNYSVYISKIKTASKRRILSDI